MVLPGGRTDGHYASVDGDCGAELEVCIINIEIEWL
jgi:hypothetical protein